MYTRTVVEPDVSYTTSLPPLVCDCNFGADGSLRYPNVPNVNHYLRSRNFSDVVTPKWRELIKRGIIINNPYVRETLTTTVRFGESFTLSGAWGPYRIRIADEGKPLFGPTYAEPRNVVHAVGAQDTIDALKSKAVLKAWSRVNDASMEVLAAIGEGKDTISYIADKMFRATKIFKAVKKLDLRQLRNEITPIDYASQYMELRYALRPLCIDIGSAIEGFERKFKIPRITRGWRSEELLQLTSSTMVAPDNIYPQSVVKNAFISCETSQATRVSVGAGVMFTVDSPSVYTWGLDQLLPALWEVTYASFILDWFINVGDWLAAYSPKFAISPLASWVTVKTTTDLLYIETDASTPSWLQCLTLVSLPDTITEYRRGKTVIQVTRETHERIPNPDRALLPYVDVNLDVLKIIDLTIILKGLVGRFR